jgi:hypothetical protein
MGQASDLIIAVGAPAANFVQQYRQRLFPAAPMIFTAVEQRRVQDDKLTENDTVVAVAYDLPAVFENILRLLPLTKTIAIVSGASPTERFWQGELRRELAPLTGRVETKMVRRAVVRRHSERRSKSSTTAPSSGI